MFDVAGSGGKGVFILLLFFFFDVKHFFNCPMVYVFSRTVMRIG